MQLSDSITFGKFYKGELILNSTAYIFILKKLTIFRVICYTEHICNLKKFKVYGGLTPNKMDELLNSGCHVFSTS